MNEAHEKTIIFHVTYVKKGEKALNFESTMSSNSDQIHACAHNVFVVSHCYSSIIKILLFFFFFAIHLKSYEHINILQPEKPQQPNKHTCEFMVNFALWVIIAGNLKKFVIMKLLAVTFYVYKVILTGL